MGLDISDRRRGYRETIQTANGKYSPILLLPFVFGI